MNNWGRRFLVYWLITHLLLPAVYAGLNVRVDQEIPVDFEVRGLAADRQGSLLASGYKADGAYVYRISAAGDVRQIAGPWKFDPKFIASDSGGACYLMHWNGPLQVNQAIRIMPSGEILTNNVNLTGFYLGLSAFAITPQDDLCVGFYDSPGLGFLYVAQGQLGGTFSNILAGSIAGEGYIVYKGLASGPVNHLLVASSAAGIGMGTYYSIRDSDLLAYSTTYPFSAMAADSQGTVYYSARDGIHQTKWRRNDHIFYPSTNLYNLLAVDAQDRPCFANSNSIVRLVEAPSISLPETVSQDVGGSIQLQATVNGYAPVTYQWLRNGTNWDYIGGSSLSLTRLQKSDSGVYSLWASNVYGMATSYCRVTVVAPDEYLSRVVAWGKGYDGQAATIPGLPHAVAIAAGASHNVALNENGDLTVWGMNLMNRVITPNDAPFVEDRYQAATVPHNWSNVVAISAGGGNTTMLDASGRAGYWSDYDGDTAAFYRNDPDFNASRPHKPVLNLLSGGQWMNWDNMYGEPQWNIVVLDDGTVKGSISRAYLGGNFTLPTKAVSAAAYGSSTVALLNADGTVALWSFNPNSGPASGKLTPGPFLGLSNVIALAGGYRYCSALLRHGQVVTWDAYGTRQTNVPADLTNAVAISAGYAHTLALRSDGTVAAWGENLYGQTSLPASLTNVIAISAGFWHNLALTSTNPAYLAPPELRQPGFTNQIFSVTVPTLRGHSYYLEYKNALDDPHWTMCPPTPGDGTVKTLTAPASPSSPRFFQVRRQ